MVERRIRPHLDALPADVAARLATACEGPLPDLLDEHDPAPSLVHGDLWSGNVVEGRWLIDPAVHHADRETDLAMLTLFGSPLLVHVRLFGSGYQPGVVRAMGAAGLP